MGNNSELERGNVQRQLAIFEVARRARGRSMTEIRQMLREAFTRRRVPGQTGPWLDAVATEASYGRPYVLDLPSALGADRLLKTPDPRVKESLRQRRRLLESQAVHRSTEAHTDTPTQTGHRSSAAEDRRPSGRNESSPAKQWLVTGAVVTTLTITAIKSLRALRRKRL